MFLRRTFTLSLVLLLLLVGMAAVTAQDMMYGEAPMLAEMVAAGELPPVAERLPSNPKVIPVVAEIGSYGGTLRFGDIGERMDEGLRIRHTGLFRYNFTASQYQADLADSWEWSNENRTLTITLRDGLKWSDGDDFNSDDFRWHWEDIMNDPDVSPNGPGGFWRPGGEVATFEVIDDTTFSYTWAIPYPIAMDSFGRTHFSGDNSLFGPSHWLKQFHGKYNEDAQAMAEEAGMERWVDLLNSKRAQGYNLSAQDINRPYVDSWLPIIIESDRVLLERNPYFHQVDEAGNQLPYMDNIQVSLAGDLDIYALRLSAGELDFGVRYTRPTDLRLYRAEEENGDFTTYIAQSLRPSEFSLFPNQNFPDDVVRALFQSADFRIALSMAIDRDEMNDILFFGLAAPHPATPLKTLPWFDDAWFSEAIEYHPDQSNAMLDELGLTERDDAGFRLMSNGERMTIIAHGLVDHQPGCELIASDFVDIGIELICQGASPDLIFDLYRGNQVMTVMWHIGRATLFGRGTPDHFAVNDPARHFWAHEWSTWISSGGAAGIEPPQYIKDLNTLWDEFSQYPSDSAEAAELGAQYFAYWGEQLPIIQSVGLTPQPVIYSNRLRNVPTENLFWGSDTNFYAPFHIEQWYIDDM